MNSTHSGVSQRIGSKTGRGSKGVCVWGWGGVRVCGGVREGGRHPLTPSVCTLCKYICVCARQSDIRYGKKQRGARGRSALKSWPDYVGAGGGGKRAVSAFTFYTKGFTNVSQASVCGHWQKKDKLIIIKKTQQGSVANAAHSLGRPN